MATVTTDKEPEKTQSRAVLFGLAALKDLSTAQRNSLTGQSRMIAALCFAHQEDYFAGVVSPGGVKVDLERGFEQIDTKREKRAIVIERINFILGHLFSVMEWDGQKWQVKEDWNEPQLMAFRQALRRTLPTVAHLIQGAPEGAPVIQTEFQDRDMLESGCSAAIVTGGPQAGRLKIRQDLAVNQRTLAKAQEAGQDLAKHPPVLLDGAGGRTVEALGRAAKEALGLVQPPEEGAGERQMGALAASLAVIRNRFTGFLGHPDVVRETLPSGLVADARRTCIILAASLFVEEERPGVLDFDSLDREFVTLRTQFKEAA